MVEAICKCLRQDPAVSLLVVHFYARRFSHQVLANTGASLTPVYPCLHSPDEQSAIVDIKMSDMNLQAVEKKQMESVLFPGQSDILIGLQICPLLQSWSHLPLHLLSQYVGTWVKESRDWIHVVTQI